MVMETVIWAAENVLEIAVWTAENVLEAAFWAADNVVLETVSSMVLKASVEVLEHCYLSR